MTPRQQREFDAILERVIDSLPPHIAALLDEVPVIVQDRPSLDQLRDLGIDPSDEDDVLSLCGLHTGVANTERTVDAADMPSDIHLFRDGILDLIGGWDAPDARAALEEEIRVTLLHEIGHQFGLDEDDLDRLGYS
jgi:predicted Zn-dependent protease with MMP-like domain